MKTFIAVLLSLLSMGAGAQYLDHRTCTDGYGWAVTSYNHVLRYYSTIDSLGECDWRLYTIVSGSWKWDGQTRRAASVTSSNGYIVFVAGGTPPPPPPPVVLPTLPAPGGRVLYIAAVPLLYLPVANQGLAEKAAWDKTTAALKDSTLIQAQLDALTIWFYKESYGLALLRFKNFNAEYMTWYAACNYATMRNDMQSAVTKWGLSQFGVSKWDGYFAMTNYQCSQAHAVTYPGVYGVSPGTVLSYNQQQLEPGTSAHELGHSFSLMHLGSMIPPATTVTEYGSYVDQMGRGGASTGLTHLLALHKIALKWIVPKACVSATLRSVYDFPDAMVCNGNVIEYLQDWQQVWVTHKQYVPGTGGGNDGYEVAHLKAGESWTDGTVIVKHVAAGQVVIQ